MSANVINFEEKKQEIRGKEDPNWEEAAIADLDERISEIDKNITPDMEFEIRKFDRLFDRLVAEAADRRRFE